MRKLIVLIMLMGVLVGVGGCNSDCVNWSHSSQGMITENIQIQRQQYFDEHLNLSSWMREYVARNDALYFKPDTEADKEFIEQAMLMEITVALLCIL